VTRIVRDLAAKDYVSRQPDPRDRRVALVAITPRGRALVEEVLPLIRTMAARLRAAYGLEALSALERDLAQLIATAARTYE
jgi:DNA-binding MarR family transcriptional regulator